MSYTLHVLNRRPGASDVKGAKEILTSTPGRTDSRRNPRSYPRFARTLTAAFPDAAWAESPLRAKFENGIASLNLKSADPALIDFIAHAAQDFGFQLFDPQAEVLYRGDHVFRADGSFGAYSKPEPPKLHLAGAEVMRSVLVRIGTGLAAHGWRAHVQTAGRSDPRWMVRREVGGVRQAIVFWPIEHAALGAIAIHAQIEFSADFLDAAWRELLPEAIDAGAPEGHLRTSIHEVFGGETAAIFEQDPVYPVAVRTQLDINEWGDQFCRSYESIAAALDGAADVTGLDRLLHNAHRHARGQGEFWSFRTICSTLLLAHLADNEDFGDWVKVAESQRDRQFPGARRELVDSSRHDHQRVGHINRLIERLSAKRGPAKTLGVPDMDELLGLVCADLEPLLRRHGYALDTLEKAFTSEHARSRRYRNRFADGWHVIAVQAQPESFGLRVEVRCSPVSELLASIEANGRPPREAQTSPTKHLLQRDWLQDRLGLTDGFERDYVLRRRSDLGRALEHLRQQMESVLLPLLEQCKTLQGFDAAMNTTPPTSSVFFHDGQYEFGAAHIAAAYLARNPRLGALCTQYERGAAARVDQAPASTSVTRFAKEMAEQHRRFLEKVIAYVRMRPLKG